MGEQNFDAILQRRIMTILIGVAFAVSATVIVGYNAVVPPEGVTLAAGQVSPVDITAPRSITYDSDALTKLARQAAADSVRDLFDPPNPGVARQQVQLARRTLMIIDGFRRNGWIGVEALGDESAIVGLNLKPDIFARLLTLSDTDWKEVEQQSISLLDRTMRNEIRENNLASIYAGLPNLLGILADESNADLITALTRDFIKPNTFYNEERTRDARNKAVAAVTVEHRTFAQGQIVVRAGTIVSEADMEALTQLKLLQPADRRLQILMGALLTVLLIGALGLVYLRQLQTPLFRNVPYMLLIGLLYLAFLAGGRIFISGTDFQSHIYPAAAFPLIVVALAGPQTALLMAGALGVMIGVMFNGSLEFTTLVAVGGAAGVLSLNRLENINAYLRAGMVIGVVNVGIELLFLLTQGTTDPFRVVVATGAGILNGLFAAGLAVVGMYVISNVLNLPTSLRLIELSQPTHPVLQLLLRQAPGTYQHSLQVANLAELAAGRIGADAALLRVMALYHDIGKMSYPHFFIENQAEGMNPHDGLNDPHRSAQIIISHVTEGEKMARKQRLPAVFMDAILQHHGTTQVVYFYNKALKAVDCDTTKIDTAKFSYPGPRPQTREMAILMLADSSESIVRAKRPTNKQAIDDMVREIFEARLADGQLDDSGLTVNDLKVLREVFVSTLQSIFHPRIVYPPTPQPVEASAASQPELPSAVTPTPASPALPPVLPRSAPQESTP